MVIFKKTGPDIEMSNALRRNWNGGLVPWSTVAAAAGSRTESWPKTKTIFVQFIPEKPHLMNRILLKCC